MPYISIHKIFFKKIKKLSEDIMGKHNYEKKKGKTFLFIQFRCMYFLNDLLALSRLGKSYGWTYLTQYTTFTISQCKKKTKKKKKT